MNAGELLVQIPQWKLRYFAIPRVANTSLKLTLARLLGFKTSHFAQSVWPHTTAEQGVHNYELAPWPRNISENLPWADGVSEDNWFQFTVVRNPLERLWSAWVLLVLLEEPHLRVMNRPVSTQNVIKMSSLDEIADEFQSFLKSVDLVSLSRSDVHFIPQTKLLDGWLPMFKIFDLGDLFKLQVELTAHLQPYGVEEFVLQKVNTSLLPFGLIDLSRLDLSPVYEVYAGDYSGFHFAEVELRKKISISNSAVEHLLNSLNHVREVHRRIFFLWNHYQGKLP